MKRGDDRWLRRSFWPHAGFQLHATRLSNKARHISAHLRAETFSRTQRVAQPIAHDDNKSMKKSGARTSPFSLYHRGDPQVWKAPAVLERRFDGDSHNLIKWVADGEEGRGERGGGGGGVGHRRGSWRGSSASRKASPRTFSASTVATVASPGKSEIHHSAATCSAPSWI